MSTGLRRLILLCIGILGGVAAWPLTELIVGAQGSFPSYLLFVAVLGAAVGLLMGAFFGSAAGIFARVGTRILAGQLCVNALGLDGKLAAGEAATLGQIFDLILHGRWTGSARTPPRPTASCSAPARSARPPWKGSTSWGPTTRPTSCRPCCC